jgi:adenosylcobinamide kinase/adenosylcobinamide-phosphate guanylyltransferase
MIVLVGGGSRSGKSTFALRRARECGRPLAFIATAEALDDEMRARADAHQQERGQEFDTYEVPQDLDRTLDAIGHRYRGVVVDCLTVWLSNLMLSDAPDLKPRITRSLRAAMVCDATVVLVANEVGCGIVPENELARRFRDLAGWLNQEAARAAAEVYWMAFGIPLRLK